MATEAVLGEQTTDGQVEEKEMSDVISNICGKSASQTNEGNEKIEEEKSIVEDSSNSKPATVEPEEEGDDKKTANMVEESKEENEDVKPAANSDVLTGGISEAVENPTHESDFPKASEPAPEVDEKDLTVPQDLSVVPVPLAEPEVGEKESIAPNVVSVVPEPPAEREVDEKESIAPNVVSVVPEPPAEREVDDKESIAPNVVSVVPEPPAEREVDDKESIAPNVVSVVPEPPAEREVDDKESIAPNVVSVVPEPPAQREVDDKESIAPKDVSVVPEPPAEREVDDKESIAPNVASVVPELPAEREVDDKESIAPKDVSVVPESLAEAVEEPAEHLEAPLLKDIEPEAAKEPEALESKGKVKAGEEFPDKTGEVLSEISAPPISVPQIDEKQEEPTVLETPESGESLVIPQVDNSLVEKVKASPESEPPPIQETPESSESALSPKEEKNLVEEVKASPESIIEQDSSVDKVQESIATDSAEGVAVNAVDGNDVKEAGERAVVSEVPYLQDKTESEPSVDKAVEEETVQGESGVPEMMETVKEEGVNSGLVTSTMGEMVESVKEETAESGLLDHPATDSVEETTENLVKPEIKGEEEKIQKIAVVEEAAVAGTTETGVAMEAAEVALEGEKGSEGTTVVENKMDNNLGCESTTTVETAKDIGAVTETAKTSSEVKETSGAVKTGEEKKDANLEAEKGTTLVEKSTDIEVEADKNDIDTSAKEQVVGFEEAHAEEKPGGESEDKKEETERTDDQKLDVSAKEGGDAKTAEEPSKDVPAKPSHRQSNNLISKVKQSIVKVKKAIMGKSPSSKTTESAEGKDDINVK